MKILLVNDSSSNPNWGDRAAAISLKRMIADAGATIDAVITEDELRATSFFDRSGSEAGGGEGERRIRDWIRLFLPPVLLKLRERAIFRLGLVDEDRSGPIPLIAEELDACSRQLLQDRDKYGALSDTISGCDVVVIHGDGAMTGNGIIPRTKLFLAYLTREHFDKPVILVNHTTDFDHPDLDRMAEAVYPLLNDVTYRDRISEERCRNRWPGRYVADTAFLFAPAERHNWIEVASRPGYFDIWPDQANFDPAEPYICMGGSSAFSYEENAPPVELIRRYVALITHLRSVYHGQIVLTASDRIDENILRPASLETGLPLIGLTSPVQQCVDIVGNADAYIGGRWHVGIFALRGGTPIVPLSSKTFKMPALVQMAGLSTPAFDVASLDESKEKIGDVLLELLEAGEDLRRELRDWASSQAENCRDNVRYLTSRRPE